MKPFSILFMILLLGFQTSASELDAYPQIGNVLVRLHQSLREYLPRLQSASQSSIFENGCLVMNRNFFPNSTPKLFHVCVSSIVKGNEREDRIEFQSGGLPIQTLVMKQFGDQLSPLTRQELLRLGFRVSGVSGVYKAYGATNLELSFSNISESSKFLMQFEPVNFIMSSFITRSEGIETLRYDIGCDFCFELDWTQAQIRPSPYAGLPSIMVFSDSVNGADITPRRFNDNLAAIVFRPLAQLGGTLLSSMQQQGGFPLLRN